MTRILYMSDLHLEMERWRLRIPGWARFQARHREAVRHPARGPMLRGIEGIDLVVLAGDVHNGLRSVVYAEQVAAYLSVPVVLVAGNHEYYHQQMELLRPALFSAASRTSGQVSFLDNSLATFEIHGRRIHVLGCTLWTDYALYGDAQAAMNFAQRHMNDFRLIYNGGVPFTVRDALTRHETSRTWLHDTMKRLRIEDPGSQRLVVTHHAPSAEMLMRRVGEIAPAYASEILDEFAADPPVAWIHGHTHDRHESVVSGIRLVSAPRGYIMYEGAIALEYVPGVLDI
jgi:predicted phosphodiesterase